MDPVLAPPSEVVSLRSQERVLREIKEAIDCVRRTNVALDAALVKREPGLRVDALRRDHNEALADLTVLVLGQQVGEVVQLRERAKLPWRNETKRKEVVALLRVLDRVLTGS